MVNQNLIWVVVIIAAVVLLTQNTPTQKIEVTKEEFDNKIIGELSLQNSGIEDTEEAIIDTCFDLGYKNGFKYIDFVQEGGKYFLTFKCRR